LCWILCLCGGIPVGTGKTTCEVFFGRFYQAKKWGKLYLSVNPVRDPWGSYQPMTVHFSHPHLLLPKPV
jgi:hypothetical protein